MSSMTRKLIAACALLCLASFCIIAREELALRQHASASAVVQGRTSKQPGASVQVDRDDVPKPDAAGWRGFMRPGGDVILTWSSGKQELYPGAGNKPCVLGCVSLYADTMRAYSVATQADGGASLRADVDKLGDGWISDMSACIHACEPATTPSWPR